jgi:hypothetical protein
MSWWWRKKRRVCGISLAMTPHGLSLLGSRSVGRAFRSLGLSPMGSRSVCSGFATTC